jgi:aminopeptidase
VRTPLGTDLRFRVGDRPMNLQDGDASAARARTAKVLVDREVELPCGVLRVAPLEESVSGVIAYPVTQWDGRPVEGLKLHFEKGRVTRIDAAAGREAVEAALRSGGPGSEAFREFALGFNPELAVPERNPWIPYYGYGSGVVRLALGDNTELGGNVTSGRPRWWDLFVDTTVSVGDTVLVRSGKLAGP